MKTSPKSTTSNSSKNLNSARRNRPRPNSTQRNDTPRQAAPRRIDSFRELHRPSTSSSNTNVLGGSQSQSVPRDTVSLSPEARGEVDSGNGLTDVVRALGSAYSQAESSAPALMDKLASGFSGGAQAFRGLYENSLNAQGNTP